MNGLPQPGADDAARLSPEALRAGRFAGTAFAFFRFPGETKFSYVAQRDAPRRFAHIRDMEGLGGYVVAPFTEEESSPLLLIRPDVRTELPLPAACPPEKAARGFPPSGADRRAYGQCFARCRELFAQGTVEKIVLARRQTVRAAAPIRPVEAFFKACHLHPREYVALWGMAGGECWLTATPETLLAREGDEWRTMALAGTERSGLSPADDRTESWSSEKRKEQQYVTDDIERQLRPFAAILQKAETQPCRAGNVVHLRTDFRFRLRDGISPFDIVAALHPTPAVCGVPREAARRAIAAIEPPRGYYAGFNGPLALGGRTHLHVTLRCMSFRPGAAEATLYAGGGLLPSSREDEEFGETLHKMEAMMRVLA